MFVWIAKLVGALARWSFAHPVIALITAGIGFLTASWLEEQPWWGADALAFLVWGGSTVITGGGLAGLVPSISFPIPPMYGGDPAAGAQGPIGSLINQALGF